jgi:Uma2 family endonuclease
MSVARFEVEDREMTMTASTPRALVHGDQVVAMRGIGWEGYSTMLGVRGERRSPRIIFLDEDVWLMSPSYSHERLKERLGLFVMEVVVGLKIPCVMSGQTTFRRRSKRGGVEGDQTYYLANAAGGRGKTEIDLGVDPPPDLAIEAVATHDASEAVEVYRRLGVSEVWVCDATEVRVLVLATDGRYAESATSLAFPFLTADDIADWALRSLLSCDTDWATQLRLWVADTLPARREAQR